VTEQVWMFWTGDKYLNPAENRNMIPRTPMPQSSHHAEYATAALSGIQTTSIE
jgi:hypothetical protein